jgi:hypothetical protein
LLEDAHHCSVRPAAPRAGVLLALPVLAATASSRVHKNLWQLGLSLYGLRTVYTLLLLALWRIKRPEGLKEYSPQDLGRVLGLDRAPEVKTLRRKLARLAAADGPRSSAWRWPSNGRCTRQGIGLSISMTRPCIRPTRPSQGPRGADAYFHAGDFDYCQR